VFGNGKKFKAAKIDSLIGKNTELFGDVHFIGGLHVDGTIRGNVVAKGDAPSVLTLSDHGTIEGEVRVPNIVLNGVVLGDVHAREHVELASNARVTGNVYYTLIEMAMGAEVNGNLVRAAEGAEPQLLAGPKEPEEPEEPEATLGVARSHINT
jgi:cytoskeletal protein CcmA (bactofilin family)